MPEPGNRGLLPDEPQGAVRPQRLPVVVRSGPQQLLGDALWSQPLCHHLGALAVPVLLVHDLPAVLQQQLEQLPGRLRLLPAEVGLGGRHVEEGVVLLVEQRGAVRPPLEDLPDPGHVQPLHRPGQTPSGVFTRGHHRQGCETRVEAGGRLVRRVPPASLLGLRAGPDRGEAAREGAGRTGRQLPEAATHPGHEKKSARGGGAGAGA
mmetsp:Transcript_127184/g.359970  ORF Transcript_127184/g.359970 Transcript_127184/m.359970 type:complete len:207 (+) Transcript_127184:757-1377(+)